MMCAALVRTTPLPACASELGGKGKGYTHIQSGPAHVDTQTTGTRTTNEVGTRISVSGKRTTRTPYQGRSRGPYQARKGPRSNSPPNIATGHTHPRYTGSPAAEGKMGGRFTARKRMAVETSDGDTACAISSGTRHGHIQRGCPPCAAGRDRVVASAGRCQGQSALRAGMCPLCF